MSTIKKIAGGVIAFGTLFGGGTLSADQLINPYQTVQVQDANGVTVNALAITKASTLPEAGAVETIADTSKPSITLKKWNGEVALGITSLDLPQTTTGSRPLLSKNVDWDAGTVKMEAVPIDATTTMEDGGMEINIILNQAPASNVFTFQLDNWQNLDFFYEPPLWQEMGLASPTTDCGDEVCGTTASNTPAIIRAQNVVGSYAVYYKDHANHIEGQTNYATGKAYHIFRPQVTDAKGQSVWADLSYADGVLSVTVPQNFLDTAIYPVTVDPTVGYTTLGGSSFSPSTNTGYGLIFGSTTAATGDTVVSYSVAVQTSGTGTFTVISNVYTMVSSLPNTKLGSDTNDGIACGSTNGFKTGPAVSVSLTGGNIHNTAFDASDSCSVSDVVNYDTVGAGAESSSANAPGLVLPATWSSTGTTARRLSTYFTYTAGGGVATTPDDTQFDGTVDN